MASGDSSLVAGARRVVEAQLKDRVRVEHGGGTRVLDAATGELRHVPGPLRLESRALLNPAAPRVSSGALEGSAADAGARAAYRALLPLDAEAVRRDDALHVLESVDPQLAGRRYRVVDTGDAATLAVVRVVWLEQRDPGDDW